MAGYAYIEGIEELGESLSREQGALLERITSALMQQAEAIKAVSQAIVPVQSGALRDSAYVSQPAVVGDSVQVVIGYSAPYAAQQHELPIDHHQGQYKFLEQPVNQVSPEIAAAIAELAKVP